MVKRIDARDSFLRKQCRHDDSRSATFWTATRTCGPTTQSPTETDRLPPESHDLRNGKVYGHCPVVAGPVVGRFSVERVCPTVLGAITQKWLNEVCVYLGPPAT